jgi:hypothetical protein
MPTKKSNMAKPAQRPAIKRPRFKPGDIYEDWAFHPCLCTEVSYRDDMICGISLIDGSAPRTSSLIYGGIRKLTPTQAQLWKQKGPQDLDIAWQPTPDKQWWWPKPLEGINPGTRIEHLFFASLLFLRNDRTLKLPEPITGWFDSSAQFDETGRAPYARARYSVRFSNEKATVEVKAVKEGRLWPITQITFRRKGRRAVVFTGEEVRGCGRAA